MPAIIQALPPNTSGPAFASTGAGGNTGAAASLTESNTLTAGATALAWLLFANNVSDSVITSATYGGVAMTQLGSPLLCATNGGYQYWLTAFILANILGGSRNLVITPHATSFMKSNLVAYANVQSWAAPVTTTGAGTSMSHTVSSAAKRVVAQCFWPPLAASIASYNQNSRWNNASGAWGTPVQVGDAAGAASVAFAATASVGVGWGSMAVELA